MDQNFIDILLKLVDDHGTEPLLDIKKCKAFLSDYTKNEFKKEKILLERAIEAKVSNEIAIANELEICKKIQIRTLHEDHLTPNKSAEDIVNLLALVLRNDTTITESEETIKAKAEIKAKEEANIEEEARKKEADSAARRAAAEEFKKNIESNRTIRDENNYEEQFNQAMEYYNAKQYQDALPILEKLSNEGYAPAQEYYGFFFDAGLGVKMDRIKSFEWYLKAAEQGSAKAQCVIGTSYYDGVRGAEKNIEKAIEWYRKSAEQGNEDAKRYLDNIIIQNKFSNIENIPERILAYYNAKKYDFALKEIKEYIQNNENKDDINIYHSTIIAENYFIYGLNGKIKLLVPMKIMATRCINLMKISKPISKNGYIPFQIELNTIDYLNANSKNIDKLTVDFVQNYMNSVETQTHMKLPSSEAYYKYKGVLQNKMTEDLNYMNKIFEIATKNEMGNNYFPLLNTNVIKDITTYEDFKYEIENKIIPNNSDYSNSDNSINNISQNEGNKKYLTSEDTVYEPIFTSTIPSDEEINDIIKKIGAI